MTAFADMHDWGAAWLSAQQREHLSTTVTYRRGGSQGEIAAMIGRTRFEQADETGVVRTWEARDYLIATADLVIQGVETRPTRGDIIVETVAGVESYYEVCSPAGEPVWSWDGTSQHRIRVHAKKVASP